jgi:DNA segregation ATPase FtsK/SpoIIIE, S-DNA-T family
MKASWERGEGVARRRTAPKRSKAPPFEHWDKVFGIALLALAAITLLSLVTNNRGELTDGWLSFLWTALGVGMWIAPIALALAGLALVLRTTDYGPRLQQPVRALALVALCLVLLALLGALFPPPLDARGNASGPDFGIGGYLGWLGSQLLTAAVGRIGAFVALLLLAFLCLLLTIEVAPTDALASVNRAWRSAADWYRIRFRVSTNGFAPLPRFDAPPAARGEAAGLAIQPQASPRPVPAVSAPATSAEPTRTAPAAPRAIVPHIIGAPSAGLATQQWKLPVLEAIFETSAEHEISQTEIRTRVRIIEETLLSFGVPARVIEVNQGPAVTQFGVEPGFVEQKLASGRVKRVKVKVSKISNLANDLALALAAAPIRIEAPVPGRNIVGIEVPNMETSTVTLRAVMETEPFKKLTSTLRIALGQDVSGQPCVADLASMPHLLIAGATGSGKSVCINAIVSCLLCNNTPEDLKLLMVDPKMVELSGYNGIPHLLTPVVVELEKVVEILHWTTQEMDRRYKLFSKVSARNLEAYNSGASGRGEAPLPKIVVIIDELADLMMMAPEQVERSICRIAQMARATGIHLVIATQRPSVDVITGLIKANFPARISFAVTSQVDSRVILDVTGAERLLGHGDMLFMAPDSSKLARLQGCYVADREISTLVRYWKGFRAGGEVKPIEPMVQQPLWEDVIAQSRGATEDDALLEQAIQVVREHERASISLLQRRLRIGYSRAARLIDILEERGIVGEETGTSRSREVLPGSGAEPTPVELPETREE